MTRKTNHSRNREYHYYYCRTGKKHGCSAPVMLREEVLIACVQESLKAYINNVISLEAMLSQVDQKSINHQLAKEYAEHIEENERRLEKVLTFKAKLYESLVDGMVTREEYASYKAKYTAQAEEIRASIKVLQQKMNNALENSDARTRWMTIFKQFATLETLDRKAVVQLIQKIRVVAKENLEISFNYQDEFDRAATLAGMVEKRG